MWLIYTIIAVALPLWCVVKFFRGDYRNRMSDYGISGFLKQILPVLIGWVLVFGGLAYFAYLHPGAFEEVDF